MPLYVPPTRCPARGGASALAWLPAGIFALKLIASALAGATITLALWPADRKPVAPQTIESVRAPSRRRRTARTAGSTPAAVQPQDSFEGTDPQAERPLPLNYPRRVQTRPLHRADGSRRLCSNAPVPPLGDLGVGKRPDFGALAGKPLRYLIGGSAGQGGDDEVTMVSYSTNSPVKRGISIAYCNLFDEHNSGHYGPYLHNSDTAEAVQRRPDRSAGRRAGRRTCASSTSAAARPGFEYIELDNPDAYKIKDVIGAIELAATYNLKVIAKNPGITDDPVRYVSHPNVYRHHRREGRRRRRRHGAIAQAGRQARPAGVVRGLRLRPQMGRRRRQ